MTTQKEDPFKIAISLPGREESRKTLPSLLKTDTRSSASGEDRFVSEKVVQVTASFDLSARYRAFLDSNKEYCRTDLRNDLLEDEDDLDEIFLKFGSHPTVNVTWNDAFSFCEWLSTKTGDNIRLPKEWEWKQAALKSNQLKNSFKVRRSPTRVVGLYPQGDLLACANDMSGNIFEWCSNTYDIAGPVESRAHEIRTACSGSDSRPYAMSSRNPHIGFRICSDSPSSLKK